MVRRCDMVVTFSTTVICLANFLVDAGEIDHRRRREDVAGGWIETGRRRGSSKLMAVATTAQVGRR